MKHESEKKYFFVRGQFVFIHVRTQQPIEKSNYIDEETSIVRLKED